MRSRVSAANYLKPLFVWSLWNKLQDFVNQQQKNKKITSLSPPKKPKLFSINANYNICQNV